jgi:uncharacterized membrane protein YphA (DoxX/SURF4 family)
LVARLIIGGALLIAGLLSIVNLRRSVVKVQAYELPIPEFLVTLIGYCLPVVEIVVGAAILAGFLTRWTAAIGGFLMIVYIAGIASAWARGLNIDCGCFTPGGMLEPGQDTKYLTDIVRDIGFLACSVWLVIFPTSRISIDSWIRSPIEQEHYSDQEKADISIESKCEESSSRQS